MVIYILLASIIGLFLLSFLLFDRDIFHPACLLCLSFLVGVSCTIYNIDTWGVKLHWNTYGIICGGLLAFIFSSYTVHLLKYAKNKKLETYSGQISLEQSKLRYIEVQSWKYVAIAILLIVFAIYYFLQVRNLVADHGYSVGSWNEIMHGYRNLVSFQRETSLNKITLWSFQFLYVLGITILYIAIQNYIVAKKIDKLAVPCIIESVALSLLDANRLNLIRFAVGGIFAYILISKKYFGKQYKLGFKTIFRILQIIVGVLIAFVVVKRIVGRQDTMNDPIYYLTYYLGGGIWNLDMYLQNPTMQTAWGEETFPAIISFFGNLFGDRSLNFVTQKEYRSSNGMNTGNIYTIFRSLIHDFGVSGMLLLTCIVGIIYTLLYYGTFSGRKHKHTGAILEFTVFIWMYVAVFLCLGSYADYLTTNLFSFDIIQVILYFLVQRYFLCNLKVVWGTKPFRPPKSIGNHIVQETSIDQARRKDAP